MASKIQRCSRGSGQRIFSSPDWCNIDIDIFECIQKKMSLPDLLLCRAVCKSWRSLIESRITSASNSPVLMLCKQYFLNNLSGQEDYVESSSGRCLMNPATKTFYELSCKSRELLGESTFCVGSSHGWMLLMRKQRAFLLMLHASFGAGIIAPFPYCSIRRDIVKAVLTADPILSSNKCCIVAIYRDYKNVGRTAYAKYGHERFVGTGDQVDEYHNLSYVDIISFRHCAYAVKGNGSLRAWDCNIMVRCRSARREYSHPKIVMYLKPCFNQGKELKLGSKLHLVESQGDLLLVSRIGSKNMALFQVYKLDFDEKKWVDMDSLGDRVLFLFVNQSISLLAGDCPNFRKNLIYFEDEEEDGCGIYVYNYDVGSAHQTYL